MCIAINKPFGSVIPEDQLKESFCSNPHGAGFAVSDGVNLNILKGFFNYEDFLQAFKQYNNEKYSCIVHFRWATHGAQNTENCHPFGTFENGALQYAMIHNGILPQPYGRFLNGKSDTRDFSEITLSPILVALGPDNFKNPSFIELLSRAIGDGNKISIINRYGDIITANSHLGNSNGKLWYSNFDYIPAKIVVKKEDKVKKSVVKKAEVEKVVISANPKTVYPQNKVKPTTKSGKK